MSAVARPQLRGFLRTSLKRSVVIAVGVSLVSTVAWRIIVGDARKKKYMEFYKAYDPQAEFDRMKAAGIFHSVNPDGSVEGLE